MGIPEAILLRAGDPAKNPFAVGAADSLATKESYRAGFDLYNGVTLQNVMRNRGRKMQEPHSWSSREWPSWEPTTKGLTRLGADLLKKLIE